MPQRCQLGSILSYGSEGTVYSGSWCGKSAAIKVFSKHYACRAENEMKLVTGFNHINIIKYFDFEYEQANAYLTMEYITGGNLYEFIRTKFTSDSYWTIICQILSDIARGMVYLHDRNIVQGDLKSHNILLREEIHQGVICDFGISRSLENDSGIKKRNQTAKGTIRWMAPEICTPPPEQSSFESDVWSYGCIVLETTSGREPWINQFIDDAMLFRALQRKENAPVFARICADESGPSYICKLLIQCCAWSKANRPRFVNILNCLETVRDKDTFLNDNFDQMSIDIPVSNDLSYFNEDYTKEYNAPKFQEDKKTDIRPIRSLQSEQLNEHSKKLLPRSNRSQEGRLTGELFTSRGSASGRPIYEGVRGGRYYLTESGSKIYLHK
ncbi:unnamed protein product [Rotaria sp. Silwood2]|nr:unnamed protein product [Rotaria sp. Silwood2]CAF3335960.1 unnamed protein product [Rotaria sp. Silwood2]CAF4355041.1 unnamed protein product [Rotaria sp. Silwood2]CAF4494039.1 unnamed protein product [Rotaria sp. Silwood2]